MKGFKEFLMRGNLIDLAVAFILGASFGAVVTAFTKIVTNVIGLLGAQPNFDAVAIGPINIGQFINALIAFVILAVILYFALVRPIARINAKRAAEEPEAPTAEELLTEIRDLLAQRDQH